MAKIAYFQYKFIPPEITAELYADLKSKPVAELTRSLIAECRQELKPKTIPFIWIAAVGSVVVGLLTIFGAPEKVGAAAVLATILGLYYHFKTWNSFRTFLNERREWYLRWKKSFDETSDYSDFMKRSGYGYTETPVDDDRASQIYKDVFGTDIQEDMKNIYNKKP